jgi:ParB-like chromosome segregation protein Spo0J
MTQTTQAPAIQLVNTIGIRPGDNDRRHFNARELEELAASIAEHGLAQPITVRPVWACKVCGRRYPGEVEYDEGPLACESCRGEDCFEFYHEIVAGERRFRACSQVLGWAQIPAIVRQMDDEQASAIMLAENVHRVDLNPMDEAHAYHKRMEQFGWTPAEVARNANVTAKRVAARLLLLDLVPEVQKLIADGQLSVGFGEAMAPLDVNRQRIAMRYFQTTEKPLLREFRAVVGKLLQDQAQDAMFDLDAFVVQVVEEHNAERDEHLDRRFPTDESLPLMERNGTVGLSLETYIARLLRSDDPHQRQAAAVVGRVYEAMLAAGMAFPPRPERGSPLDDRDPA